MKKKSYLQLITCAVFLLVAVIFFVEAEARAGGPPQIISLKSEPEGISPSTLKVKLGNTVIWHNNGPGSVKINFITRLGIACATPVNFYGDLYGNYETSAIPEGGVASICLIEEGEYDYEVRRMVSKEKEKPYEMVLKGRIISVK